MRKLPYIRLSSYISSSYWPAVEGSLLACLTGVLVLLVVPYMSAQSIVGVKAFRGAWDLAETSAETERVIWKGRVGLFIMSLGLYMLIFGSSLLIPIPKAEEEKIIIKNMRDKEGSGYQFDERNKANVKRYGDEPDSYLLTDSEVEDEDRDQDNEDIKQEEEMRYMQIDEILEKYPDKSPIYMLEMKRRVYWVCQFLVYAFFGLFLNMGYREFYRSNILVIVPVMLLFGTRGSPDYFLLFTVKLLLLKEVVLASPILVVFEFVQVMNLFSAKGLFELFYFWLYRMFWVVVFRVLVEPVVFNSQRFLTIARNYLKKKAQNDDRYERYLNWLPAVER